MPFSTLDLILFSREALLETFDGLTLEQVNRIPAGFKNNLVWQLGHVIVTEQKYIYEKSGHPITTDDSLYALYGNGTVPTASATQAHVDMLKKLALTTLEQIRTHRAEGFFKTFTPFTLTKRELPVTSIDDALQFILFHEGMHLGNARDLKRAVSETQALAA